LEKYSFIAGILALMNIIKTVLFTLLIACSIPSLGQDQSNFSQFYLNPYLINPSYAGLDGQTAASLIYRRQWMDIEGGPQIVNFALHTPISARTAFGFNATNDSRGLLTNSSALFSFSYNVPLQEHAYLRFGISGGGSWNTVDLAKLQSIGSDPAIINLLENNASLTGNAGLSVHVKYFHIGVAMPSIFSPSFVADESFNISEVKPFQTILVNTSYRFYLGGDKHVFEPYFVYRLNQGLPSQFEAAGIIHLNHLVWLGGSYKQDFGISAMGGVKVKDMFAIGGSYSLKNTGMNELNSGTFEVSLNYLFGAKKKGAHLYSFVNTSKEKEKKKKSGVSASEAIAAKRKQQEEERKKQLAQQQEKYQKQQEIKKAETKLEQQKKDEALALQREEERKRQLAAQQKEEEKKKQLAAQQKKNEPKDQTPKTDPQLEQKKKEEALAQHREQVKKLEEARKNEVVVKKETPLVTTQATAPDTVKKVTHNPRFKHQMLSSFEEGDHEHEQEQIKRLEVHAEDATDHHGEEGHPHAERHEFWKQGDHEKELDVADYVIGGVFRSEANARHFSEGVNKLGFKTHYGHLTEKNLWYVYLIRTTDINEARAERDRVRKMKMFRDSWLLTVHQ